jgi:hypothetical protein
VTDRLHSLKVLTDVKIIQTKSRIAYTHARKIKPSALERLQFYWCLTKILTVTGNNYVQLNKKFTRF